MVLSLLAVTLIPLFASCMLFVLTAIDRSHKFRRFPKAIGRYRLSRLGTLLVHLSVVALWMLLLLYWSGPAMLFLIFKFNVGGALAPHNVSMCELPNGSFEGSGLWRDVHSATWQGTKVAVKRLRSHKSHLSSEGWLIDWLNRNVAKIDTVKEAAFGAALRGTAHTVQVLAYCPDTRAVIVEWGSELKCIRESSSARTDATKLAMLSQMAAGVQDVHSIGVIHGDIKMSNFRIRAAAGGSEQRVLLGDFNRAMLPYSGGQTCQALAKGPWRAPEEYSGDSFSVAADVFSMGVTMWCWLSCIGRPYPSVVEKQIESRVAAGTLIPDVSAVQFSDKNIEHEVRQLLDRCFATDPSDRPSAGMVKTQFLALKEKITNS